MGLVWFLSAQSHLSTELGWIDMVLRKAAHMTEFGLLALLWARALRWGARRARRAQATRRTFAIGAGASIALAWAITDELHQSAVSGRVGTPVDVVIDAVGILVAVLLWRRWALPDAA